MLLARVPQGRVEFGQVTHRGVQLPTQLADIVDPQRAQRDAGNGDLLPGQPLKTLVREVGVGDGGKNIARLRTGEHKVAALIGDVGDGHVLAVFDMLDQPVKIANLGGGTGQQIVPVVGQTRDRAFAFDPAVVVEEMAKADAARPLGHLVGDDAVQERFGILAGHVRTWRSRRGRRSPPRW